MIEQGARYDRIAEGYARWWAPVLTPAVERLVDRLEPPPEGSSARIVDVGTGTGQLALGVLERWPTASVDGIDASSEMCAIAASEADRRLRRHDRDRFRTAVATADRMPFEDETFDLATCSFVLQLVPNRHRALREIHRVLRPGASFHSVTWLTGGPSFEPDRIFDALLDELGIESGEGGGDTGDFTSMASAIGIFQRAGFRAVEADESTLEHEYTIDEYVGFLTEFDETSLFEDLEPDERDWLLATLRERSAGLTRAEMTMRYPIVFVSGRR